MASQKERVVIVTGGNKGIGYSIVESTLKQLENLTIVLTSRNPQLGEEAVKKLLEKVSDSKSTLQSQQLDICDSQSVTKFIEWAKEKFGKIDILVNNAGVQLPEKREFAPDYIPTEEEFNYVIGTNYIKTREFTEKILPILSDDGKILNISAELGSYKDQGSTAYKLLMNPDFQEKDLDSLLSKYQELCKEKKLKEEGYTNVLYNFSKALMDAWTHVVLPQKVKSTQQVYSVWPGWCRTDLGGAKAIRSPEEGADTAVYLIGLPYTVDNEINAKTLRDRKVVDHTSFTVQRSLPPKN